MTADVPASLRRCKIAPVWNAQTEAKLRQMTQRDVARFVTLLADAHTNCRTKLQAVDRILTETDNRTKQK